MEFYCGLTRMPRPRRGRGVALPFAPCPCAQAVATVGSKGGGGLAKSRSKRQYESSHAPGRHCTSGAGTDLVRGTAHAQAAPWFEVGVDCRAATSTCSRKKAGIFFGWVFFLISSGSPHVRCTPMGRTCGEPDEIELTPMGVKLNGSGRVLPLLFQRERHKHCGCSRCVLLHGTDLCTAHGRGR